MARSRKRISRCFWGISVSQPVIAPWALSGRCPDDPVCLSGKPASKSYIDALLSNKPSLTNNDEDDSYDIHQKPTSTSSAPRSLNFTQFLTMFCTHLLPFSTEQEMVDAFGCWDESDEGVLDIEEYRKWQKEWGTVSGDEEVRVPKTLAASDDKLAV